MPGGVSSPVRSFASVGGEPFFVVAGRGSRVRDADGRSYLDYVMSYGPHLFGHGPHFRAPGARPRRAPGNLFRGAHRARGAAGREGLEARALDRNGPLRQLGHGSHDERRAAGRGATGRKRIVKTDGGYHGHADGFLVSAGSGVATLGIAGSPGVPEEIAALTTVVPYNDASALEEAFRKFPGEIAAFIVEPVAANMGLVLPAPGYLEAVA